MDFESRLPLSLFLGGRLSRGRPVLSRRSLLCAGAAALLASSARAAKPTGGFESTASGLIEVQSPLFDQLYRRPSITLAEHRRVMLDAPRVEFSTGWRKRINQTRGVGWPVSSSDIERIERRVALGLRQSVLQVLTARRYVEVSSAAPDVLRLSLAVTELFIDAPFVPAPGIQIGIVHQSAGAATMRLEVRVAGNEVPAIQLADRDEAQTLTNFSEATDVSNLFWFNAMFRRWAERCVVELQRDPPAA